MGGIFLAADITGARVGRGAALTAVTFIPIKRVQGLSCIFARDKLSVNWPSVV